MTFLKDANIIIDINTILLKLPLISWTAKNKLTKGNHTGKKKHCTNPDLQTSSWLSLSDASTSMKRNAKTPGNIIPTTPPMK
jgi:hypothetical protein